MASGQELNVGNAQIRTLLDRQKEQILAECQAEIKEHEFQADYDRRSVRTLSEIIESQREELHCAQAEELHRRDQQLLQNYVKLITKVSRKWKNKEVSEFHLRHCCKKKIGRRSGHYLGTYWQDTGIAK